MEETKVINSPIRVVYTEYENEKSETFSNIIKDYLKNLKKKILVVDSNKYFDDIGNTNSIVFDFSISRDNLISIYSKYGSIFVNWDPTSDNKHLIQTQTLSFPLEYVFKSTPENLHKLFQFLHYMVLNHSIEENIIVRISCDKEDYLNSIQSLVKLTESNLIYFGNSTDVLKDYIMIEKLSCVSNNVLDSLDTKNTKIIKTDKFLYTLFRSPEYFSKHNQHQEFNYLDVVYDCINRGRVDQTRNGKTYSLFGKSMEFDISKSIPVMTTKKMFWRGIVEELLFFLRGETDSKILEQKGVNIWKHDTSAENLKKLNLPYEEGQMGPMYGYQWRFYGKPFNSKEEKLKEQETCNKTEYVDQLEHCINEIITNPTSRRILMTTFNPIDVRKSVLYPCHGVVTQFYVRNEGTNSYIDTIMYQR